MQYAQFIKPLSWYDYYYLDYTNIGDAGVLHLSKGKWENLQRIYLSMRLFIKTIHVLGKCARSGLLKEIGRNWKEYGCVYFKLIQEIKAWKPINASISSSATSNVLNISTSII
jgi:hypothetical protein